MIFIEECYVCDSLLEKLMKDSKKPELGNSDNQPARSTQDDRYSSWRDGRYESKGMKRWLADFRFDLKHFSWPIFKWFFMREVQIFAYAIFFLFVLCALNPFF